ncbi:DNA-binding transcriptional activator of the SARP family [Lentzea albidocapillata subsp. violacea]|uniref:DNA-binding transcriptional activator of the SARP family n=1 Tax=Lentzea albidocapillata subsp. violacea TaxID=128104 RepID=A0A1G9BGK7_9PSEU|nr:BTAD domain-containing putative transcriptional regulator [Lentzea albidocapillata]SDK38658.1 DNA-binding transcriptional activator of the SARP family [Lentzea albidocapillata subsp. violacea]
MASGPQFRLLGPLEVRLGGSAVVLRAGKHRALLAALLLRPNRVVPVTELVEHVWGDTPPARTRGTLQTYVMRLRAALGDPSLIQTAADGYRMRVDPLAVDAHRFADAAARGRAAASSSDLVTARSAFAEALELWRGPVLSDVPSETLYSEHAPRLTELLMRVHEQRIDVELALGNHADLVPELFGLTRDHPLRERFWAQLMLALYRGSRQAEALEAFRQLDRTLDEQLGIDPSDELRSLHQAILMGAPELAAPVVAREPERAPSSPMRLPDDIADFTGRSWHVERVSGLIAGGSVPIVTLAGQPGVGKTTLAVHVAHLLRDRFPDGQLYVDLRGYALGAPADGVDVLSRFLRALGVPPDEIPPDADEQSTMLRSLLSGRRMLLVLDNASAPDQVRPLLPGTASCRVIVTSRDDLRGLIAMNGARTVPVDVFPAAESASLLEKLLGPGDHAELAARCGHLPLALRVAAAYLAGRDGVTISGSPIELAYAALPPAPQRLFRLLSLVPGPDFTPEAASALADVDADGLLAVLAIARLVVSPVPGRYRFHDELVRYAATVREEADSPSEQQASWTALLDHYLRGVERCAELLYPGIVRLPSSPTGPAPRISTSAEALVWLDAERPNLIAAIRHAAEHGPVVMAWQLADALRGYLWIGQHVGEWLATAHHGLQAAQKSAHRAAEAAMHANLGTLYLRLGEYTRSVEHHDHAIELYRALGDKDAEAGALNNLSLVHRRSGDLVAAKDALVRCLEMLRSAPADSVSTGLYNLGQLAVELGEIDSAVEHFSQALTLAPNADSHTYLGMALRLQGRLDEARAHLERALEIGNVPAGESEALENLAALELASGNTGAALSLASRALSLVADGGDQQVATSVRITLGETRRALSDFDAAAELFEQALTTARRIGFASGEVRALINLAVVLRDLDRPADSRSAADQAARRSAELGLRALENRARELA